MKRKKQGLSLYFTRFALSLDRSPKIGGTSEIKEKNLVFSLYFTRFALSLHACSDSHTTKTVLIRDNTKDSDAKDKQ